MKHFRFQISDFRFVDGSNFLLYLKSTIYNQKSSRGIAALVTIIVVGAAALLMAMSASILGIGELDMGYTAQKGKETDVFADACVEEALHRLRLDSNYMGGSLSLDANSCIISVTANGNDRTVVATAQSGNYFEKRHAQLSVTNNVITLSSWEVLSN